MHVIIGACLVAFLCVGHPLKNAMKFTSPELTATLYDDHDLSIVVVARDNRGDFLSSDWVALIAIAVVQALSII